MKILVFGAGVIGSIYAAKLFQAKNDVTLLARNKRYTSLEQKGVIIREYQNRSNTTLQIPLIQQLKPEDFFDLIIITVRLDQLESVIPDLLNNKSSVILFMLNNTENLQPIADKLKPKQVIFGFPGVGGTMEEDVINFIQIKQQKTTLGEIQRGNFTNIKKLKSVFETAGFETAISNNIGAWLKTHAVFISCVCASIIKENGDSRQLGKNKKSIQLMIKSIKEGFLALQDLGIPITPYNLKIIFMMMPKWFSVSYWQKAMQSEMGTLAIAPHANAAKKEMQLLGKKVLKMIHASSLQTPDLDLLLHEFINE